MNPYKDDLDELHQKQRSDRLYKRAVTIVILAGLVALIVMYVRA